MSYILEALQKSERKRQKDAVPNLQAVHAADRGSKERRHLWPWLLVTVIVVNAVLLITFLPFFRDDVFLTDQGLTENRQQGASQQSLTEKPPANKPAKEPISVKHDTIATATVERTHPVEIQSEKPVETNALPPAVPVTQPSVATEQSPDVLHPNVEKPLAADTVLKHPARETNGQKTHPQENMISSPVDIPEPTDLTEAEDSIIAERGAASAAKEIPLFESLPQSLRQQLPALSISFLAYSQKPSERIVSINSTIMREGQTIANGLTLEEITSAGAILNYRGDRFRLEVF